MILQQWLTLIMVAGIQEMVQSAVESPRRHKEIWTAFSNVECALMDCVEANFGRVFWAGYGA